MENSPSNIPEFPFEKSWNLRLKCFFLIKLKVFTKIKDFLCPILKTSSLYKAQIYELNNRIILHKKFLIHSLTQQKQNLHFSTPMKISRVAKQNLFKITFSCMVVNGTFRLVKSVVKIFQQLTWVAFRRWANLWHLFIALSQN